MFSDVAAHILVKSPLGGMRVDVNYITVNEQIDKIDSANWTVFNVFLFSSRRPIYFTINPRPGIRKLKSFLSSCLNCVRFLIAYYIVPS